MDPEIGPCSVLLQCSQGVGAAGSATLCKYHVWLCAAWPCSLPLCCSLPSSPNSVGQHMAMQLSLSPPDNGKTHRQLLEAQELAAARQAELDKARAPVQSHERGIQAAAEEYDAAMRYALSSHIIYIIYIFFRLENSCSWLRQAVCYARQLLYDWHHTPHACARPEHCCTAMNAGSSLRPGRRLPLGRACSPLHTGRCRLTTASQTEGGGLVCLCMPTCRLDHPCGWGSMFGGHPVPPSQC